MSREKEGTLHTKSAYEIPHIIQGGFHPERRRSDGGFLIATAMRIPGRTQSAKAAATAFPMQSDTRAYGAGHRERPEWKEKKWKDLRRQRWRSSRTWCMIGEACKFCSIGDTLHLLEAVEGPGPIRNPCIDTATEESHQWTIHNQILVNASWSFGRWMHDNRLPDDPLRTNQDAGELSDNVHFITEIAKLLINVERTEKTDIPRHL